MIRRAGLLMLFTVLLVSGCATTSWNEDSPRWVVATTNFSETNLIAQMYAQVLNERGYPAEIKQLGNREVIMPALSSGQVQITPEYLGSFTEFVNRRINGPDAPQAATGDAEQTYDIARGLAAEVDITLLPPSAAQDQNAFAVTGAFAREHNLRTLSDLAAYSQQNPVNLGAPPECPQRQFCLPGLEQTYGMSIAEFVPLDAGGPLTIQALRQGRVDVGLVFSSSGSVAGNDLVVLDDDKQLQTAENIVPAVYTPAAVPGVVEALNEVSAALTTEKLQEMNSAVEIYRDNPRLVAQDFLQQEGILPMP